MKTFGTRGPVDAAKNYVVKRSEELANLIKRIRRGHYIVVFAPPQTGKTTFFQQAIDALAVEEPTYLMIQLNFENRENLSAADFYQALSIDLREEIKKAFQKRGNMPSEALTHFLENAQIANNVEMLRFYRGFEKFLENQKFIIFIDKFHGIPLVLENSFLASLRSIYNRHYERCPQSVIFESVEWFIQRDSLSAVSPFNVQDDYGLPSFTLEQVQELLGQYTDEVGQAFTSEVIEALHKQTEGHPLLVNQFAQILTEALDIPKTEVITMEHFSKAQLMV